MSEDIEALRSMINIENYEEADEILRRIEKEIENLKEEIRGWKKE